MPLTTTATWPSLVAGRKARASDVEAKFDWLEGSLLPMSGGNFTTGAYDIGSSAYKWRNGIFSNSIVIGSATLTSGGIGESLKAWGVFQYYSVPATMTTLSFHNISSISRNATGDFLVSFTLPFADAYPCVLLGRNSALAKSEVTSLSTTSTLLKFFNSAGAPEDPSRIEILVAGNR